MFKILIVEDDKTISRLLKSHLEKWGYNIVIINNFEKVDKEIIDFEPHLVLLDIMLPYYNGFHWCNEIRKFSKVPVIFLSSASDNMNIVMAMNMGGDDFISKPFDINVLTAKIQALLRRTYSFKGQSNTIEYKGVILNLNDTSIIYNNNKYDLTKNEFKILQILMENHEKVMSRDKIIEYLWQTESFIDDNTLTVNVTRLRKKLEDIGIVNFIKTKKGLGYIVE